LWRDGIDVYLSGEHPVGALPAWTGPSLKIRQNNTIARWAIGDVNGDGLDDLVTTGSPEGETVAGAEVFGMTAFFHGYRPLGKASLSWHPWKDTPSPVDLTVRIDGQPDEMKLTGDIQESFRGRWVPFQSTVTVRLTPVAGVKTVKASFRHARRPQRTEAAKASCSLTEQDVATILAYERRYGPSVVVRKKYEEGVAAYTAGRLEEARVLLREARALAPDDAAVLRALERTELAWRRRHPDGAPGTP
jgi:hypothetical protein